MTNHTTPPSTPLDTLKYTFWVIREGIGLAISGLTGTEAVDEEHWAIRQLDYMQQVLVEALAEHVEGVRWNEFRVEYTEAGLQAARTYDDGTPVFETIDFGKSITDYYPRYHGDRDEFIKEHQPKAAGPITESEAQRFTALLQFPTPDEPHGPQGGDAA
ncbi:hypothetical protein GCM10022198_00440 [Klugiella xanthotipulae]|uniref:Uncharacterized protein n=1 Tax=Klugiella xanthotipulae TaxID=244735 RepID=A0A543I5F9_9MICO|nr:hypothetical protein [Klugiella xanthotipulae]TQM65817.1 hypothetical protein FB466_0630 [Klugiella xanthotipulae]